RPIMDFVNFGTKPEEALSAIKGIGERYNSNMGYAARHFVDERYVRAALYCAAIRFMELGMKEAMNISLGEMEITRSKAADEHVRGWWERQGMPTVPKEMVIRND
ncbi:hypothetical protein KJ780_03085, partial [Candidatus Micrarchaeota archaeon]|nr:hypothetical protein [Candidatus Micrarchaeota archaeon]